MITASSLRSSRTRATERRNKSGRPRESTANRTLQRPERSASARPARRQLVHLVVHHRGRRRLSAAIPFSGVASYRYGRGLFPKTQSYSGTRIKRPINGNCVAWIGQPNHSATTRPMESRWRCPLIVEIVCCGSTPRDSKMVAVRSAGETGLSITSPA